MTTFDRSDDELVAAARQGEAAAMDALLRRHYDRVHAVCRRIAGSSRDADDAAQEAMIRIVNNLDKFDGRSAFGTWAYRIATNTSLDELRKRKRRPQLHSVGDDDGSTPPEPADELSHRVVESVADRMAIDAALADLPDDFRIPVVMRDVGDLDYAEIATELDVPVGTVKSRIARGRRMLVERLEHDGPPTSGGVGNRDAPSERPTSEHHGGSPPVRPPDTT